MHRNDSSQAILNLASAYGDDPVQGDVDDISGSDDEIAPPTGDLKRPREEELKAKEDELKHRKIVKKTTRLVSYGPGDDEEDAEEKDDVGSGSDEELEGKVVVTGVLHHSSLNSEMAASLSRSVQNMAADEIRLPPEPPGKCSQKLQDKIIQVNGRMQNSNLDLNASIQRRKDVRNPSIYEKLINFIGIDEKGTNYPPEIYNPSIWGPESYYDELAKMQKIEMDKREKEKKERTKIEFVTGTKKAGEGTEQKRKTKWDAQPPVGIKPIVITTTSINPPVVSVTTSATGTKTTVISAVGTIKKPK